MVIVQPLGGFLRKQETEASPRFLSMFGRLEKSQTDKKFETETKTKKKFGSANTEVWEEMTDGGRKRDKTGCTRR